MRLNDSNGESNSPSASSEIASLLRRQARRAILRFASYPLVALLILLTVPLFLSYADIISYAVVMPDVLVMSGIVVIFFGAYYDFGAKTYVKDVVAHGLPFNEEDADYIYKQQFKLTAVYAGIGGIYILSGILIFVYA
ncbi:MAG: hypothetical protein QXP70_05165 [Methanomassiliicoccales archaeon]